VPLRRQSHFDGSLLIYRAFIAFESA